MAAKRKRDNAQPQEMVTGHMSFEGTLGLMDANVLKDWVCFADLYRYGERSGRTTVPIKTHYGIHA